MIPARLHAAIQAVIRDTRNFNERKQELSCRLCRYKDPIGQKLHDPDCAIYELHGAWEEAIAVPAVATPHETGKADPSQEEIAQLRASLSDQDEALTYLKTQRDDWLRADEKDEALTALQEQAALAEAYMAGMRAACGQPGGPPYAANGEPYSKGRYNFQYQQGFALNKELLGIFARRTDDAQKRAEQAEAQLQAQDEAIATLRAEHNQSAVQLAELLAAHRDGQTGSDCSDINDPGSCNTCNVLDIAIKTLSGKELGQPDAAREALLPENYVGTVADYIRDLRKRNYDF